MEQSGKTRHLRFKKGDRVAVARDIRETDIHLNAGQVGTVEDVFPGLLYPYEVKIDGQGSYDLADSELRSAQAETQEQQPS